MISRYSAFLVRHWRLTTGVQRIEAVHIQSGTRLVTPTVAEAIAWICAYGEADATRADTAAAGHEQAGEPRTDDRT